MENNKTSKPKTSSQALGTFNGLLTDFLNKSNQLIKHTANFVITATFEMLWKKNKNKSEQASRALSSQTSALMQRTHKEKSHETTHLGGRSKSKKQYSRNLEEQYEVMSV